MKKIIYILIPVIGVIVAVLVQYRPEKGHEREIQHLELQAEYDCTHEKGVFCTKLPIVSINTGGQEIAGMEDDETRTNVEISILDEDGVYHHPEDTPDIQSDASIKYRGNSSLYFDKKSFSINLLKKDGTENKKEIMGMASNDQWILNGPFLDKTMIRNYLCMNVAGQIMEYAPNVRYCELFVDGEYRGVYVMMERISRDLNRINISGVDSRTSKTGFIIRIDRGDKEYNNLFNFTKYTRKLESDSYVNIEYPGQKNLAPSTYDYIEEKLTKFEKVLYSYDYNSDAYGYENYIDIDSFVQYFIINEYFMNIDAGIYSTYYYQDIGGKMKLCVWDFNNCCDNYMEIKMESSGFYMVDKTYFEMLVKDEKFVNQVIQTYKSLRKTVLSDEYITNYIDDTVVFLGDAVDRNYEVWGYSFDPHNLDGRNKLMPKERNLTSYEESIEQLKGALLDRGEWMDENIDSLRQYCHDSRTKKFDK